MRVFLRVLYLLSLLQIVAGGTAYVAGVLGYDVSSLVPVGIGIAGVLVSFVAVVVGLKICSKHRLTTHNGQNDSEEIVFRAAPRWVKVFAAIAAVVFGTTLITVRIVDEGGRVDRLDDGSFALKSQGRLIRRLTETEYRRCCSNESLMPAAVCMAAASFGLMAVAGAMRIRRCPAPAEPPSGDFRSSPETLREAPTLMAEIIPTGRASPVAAAASGGILVLLVLLLLTHRYAPGATAALVAMTCGVFHFRRLTREKKKELVQTPLGCIALIPCVIVAIVMAWYLQWFLYLAIAAGPVAAITESVRIVPVKGGPDMLSNGAVVNGRLLTGISLVAQPLGVILGLLGLLRLVDNVGRYLAALLRRI